MFGVSPITPAYGREYKSLKAAQESLDRGEDFMTPFGQYVGVAELRTLKMSKIQVRYGKGLTKTGILNVAAS